VPLGRPNRGRSTRISKDERKRISLLNVGHQYRPRAHDTGSSRSSNTRVNNSRGAGLEELGSECLRGNVADWRQAVSALLRRPNVMEFSAEIRAIIDVLSDFFFVPIYLLQAELLVIGNFRLRSLQFKARIPSAPIRGIEAGAVWCRVAESCIDNSVRRNSKDQFPGVDPGNNPNSDIRRSLVALSSSKMPSRRSPSSVSRVNTDPPPSAY